MLRVYASGATALAYALAIFLAGCASSGTPEALAEGPEPMNTTPPTPPPETGTETWAPAPGDPVAAIFTSGQADRGRTAFDETCSDCHTNGEFRGRTFQSIWGHRTVYSFYRTIRSTMPDDTPGGLEEETYLDVVSYILSINGHAAGSSELAADSSMRKVRMAPIRGRKCSPPHTRGRAPAIHTRQTPDIAVIGAGAFGAWTALNLQQSGAQVTLVDQYGPGNSRATSGGETRGVRTGYGDRGHGLLWTGRRWPVIELGDVTVALWEQDAGGRAGPPRHRVRGPSLRA